jgi:hypothetical protein
VSGALRRVGLGLLLAAAGVGAAWAHVGGSTGYASITVSRSTVRYALTLPTAILPPDLAETLRLAQAGSPQNRDKLLDVLRRRIILRADGTRCEPGPGQLAPPVADASSFTMQVDFACASAVRDLVVEDNIFDVLGPDHHTLAKVEAGGETRELAFAPESREGRVSVGARTGGSAEGGFFKLGVEHILTGYDHLLFLAALLLRGGPSCRSSRSSPPSPSPTASPSPSPSWAWSPFPPASWSRPSPPPSCGSLSRNLLRKDARLIAGS